MVWPFGMTRYDEWVGGGDLGGWCLVLSVMKNSVEVSGGTQKNTEVLLQKEMGQSKTETRQLNQKMNKY